MPNLKIDLPVGTTLSDGKQITFKTPCDCSAITALLIDGVAYDLVDALGNVVAGGNSFTANAMVSVIIDTDTNKAFLQNAANGIRGVTEGGTGVTSYEELKNKISFNSINIVSGADLDNFKTTGRYNAYQIAVAKSLLNNPLSNVNTGIILEVVAGVNSVNCFQIIYSTLTNDVYSRRYSGSWGDWRKISNEDKFPAIDFSTKVTLSETDDNVMADDGYVYFRLEQHSSGEASYVNFTLNGVTMPGVQTNDYSTDSILFPVKKGDVLKIIWGRQSNEQHIFSFYKVRW